MGLNSFHFDFFASKLFDFSFDFDFKPDKSYITEFRDSSNLLCHVIVLVETGVFGTGSGSC